MPRATPMSASAAAIVTAKRGMALRTACAGRSRSQARTVTMMANVTSAPARNQNESRGDISPELSCRKIYGTVVACVEESVYASRFTDAVKMRISSH